MSYLQFTINQTTVNKLYISDINLHGTPISYFYFKANRVVFNILLNINNTNSFAN